MTEEEIKSALNVYKSRLRIAQKNLEYARANVARMETALRSVMARKRRKARS